MLNSFGSTSRANQKARLTEVNHATGTNMYGNRRQ